MQRLWPTLAIALLLQSSALCQNRHGEAPPNAPQTSSFAKPSDLTEKWGDQGDGTYVNPILPADFSDTDAIRVGQKYYMISSTMQYSPGMVVLQSDDLVNWRIISHVVTDLSAIDKELNWDRMNRPGGGLWAGSIRFHSGRFWVYFGTPDQGIYASTAEQASGPWTSPHLVLAGAGWDDPCSFKDDDGQNYLVATHFAPEGAARKTYNIHLFKLSRDGFTLLPGSDRIIHRSEGSEANKLYKINGLYYHYFSEVKAEGRVPMMERSRSLHGPWQIQQLMHVHGALDKEPNQGGLVQLPSRKWYFVSHQGKGDWEGRATVLLPVHWLHGWPILGAIGADGVGNMVWQAPKPITGYPEQAIAFSDDFRSQHLAPAWEWNYQPNPAMWSLQEKPGLLRLHAQAPLRADNFKSIPNILTQRSTRASHNQFTARFNLTGMAPGQEAGIAHFGTTHASLSVVKSSTNLRLSFNNNGVQTSGPTVESQTLWLRSDWDFTGASHFSFSLDGQTFQPLGTAYQLTWGDYRGDRIAIFTTNRSSSGYIDVDEVQYESTR